MSAQVFHHLVQDYDGRGAVRTFATPPEHCPVCGRHVDPRPLAAHATDPGERRIDFAYQCPAAPCRRIFVAEYGRAPCGEYELLAVAAPEPREVSLAGLAAAGLAGVG